MRYPDDFINKVICGDCFEVMKDIPDKSIDLVLTDPPYGIGKDFENDNLSDIDLQHLLTDVAWELKRICKYNLLIDTPKNKIPLFIRAFNMWNYEYIVILHETNGMRNGKVGFNNCGIILWFSNEKRKINRYKDVISESLTNTKKEFSHPSPKNPKHYKRLIEMFSNENDLILDPFMGSGTTCVAAKKLKRNFIGIEISPKYCEIARQRLRQEILI
jgi:DNA modification methylase